jgi:hypothetical protein
LKLETVRKHALSLNDVTEEPHHEYSSFRVRGKIFVTVPPHADAIHVFLAEEDRELALTLYPDWAQKLLWGGKARGLRINLGQAEPAAVKGLVSKAYEVQSHKRK